MIVLPLYHSHSNITSKFFIQLPNGVVHELNPYNVTFTMNLGEVPCIHGDFRYGAIYDIDLQPTDEWESEDLDEFLKSIKIYSEGGGVV